MTDIDELTLNLARGLQGSEDLDVEQCLSGSNHLPSAAGNTLWALGDNQNSVRDVVNDAGILEEHVAYSPFGQQVAAQSSNPGAVNFAFGYTGTYTDPTTGFQLHGARWYDSTVGRWLSQDPIESGTNWYAYCGDAPTDATDSTGLDPGYQGIGLMGDQIKKWERERHDEEFANSLARLKANLIQVAPIQDVDAIVSGLQAAYKSIYDRGGPSFFNFNGPVCNECQDEVMKHMPCPGSRSAIQYQTQTHIGPTIPLTDWSVPGRDHAWGELRIAGQVITIDFWAGGTDFWRAGANAYGWAPTPVPPVPPAPQAPSPREEQQMQQWINQMKAGLMFH